MAERKLINGLTVALAILLVLSNVGWAYSMFDTSITMSYWDQQLDEYDRSLAQAQQLLPVAFMTTNRHEFLSIAESLAEEEGYEKDGCVWVGMLGFKFDEGDSLSHVARIWSFGSPDPCYPDFQVQ
jgi:hypothetical protein